MIPTEVRPRRVAIYRNRDALLFGVSWSHHPSFPNRKTHFYLGLWVLTVVLPYGERDGQR